jgi:hypothetical protein
MAWLEVSGADHVGIVLPLMSPLIEIGGGCTLPTHKMGHNQTGVASVCVSDH